MGMDRGLRGWHGWRVGTKNFGNRKEEAGNLTADYSDGTDKGEGERGAGGRECVWGGERGEIAVEKRMGKGGRK